MKKIFILLTLLLTLFFTSCSIASIYNLKPNQAILIPMSEPVYILQKKYNKNLKIIRLNGQYLNDFFSDNEKVETGEVTFLVRSSFMGHRRLASFKLTVQAQKAYFIYATQQGNNMIFTVVLDGKTILEAEGKRKY